MADLELSYKITILEILSTSDFPLKPSQITDFFLENKLTDYFSVQDAIASLDETQNIEVTHSANTSYYKITDKGAETLRLFAEKITPEIREDIVRFFSEHALTMKEENSLVSDYYPEYGSYRCNLRQMEDNHALVEISFNVFDEQQAKAICANWKAHFDEVYDCLMDILVR